MVSNLFDIFLKKVIRYFQTTVYDGKKVTLIGDVYNLTTLFLVVGVQDFWETANR